MQPRSSKKKLDLRLRVMVGAHLVWLMTVCLLGGWWGRLVLNQAAHIADLETALGWSESQTQFTWNKTQRMVHWEASFFFVLLLACAGLLVWLYWRDLKRSRGLQAFYVSLTHELRTPLTSIRLQAEAIAHALKDKKLKEVSRLLEDTIRLEGQVERTLELSRIEGGGPVYVQSLQVKPFLDQFLKSWQSDHSHKVQLTSSVDDVWIQADSAALQIVVKNILENSVRHAKREKVSIALSSSHVGGRVCVSFRDDGVGFQGNSSSLGQLFEKGPTSQGTGVGLYLVKALMKRMGGQAEFIVESGFGVNLWFLEGTVHG